MTSAVVPAIGWAFGIARRTGLLVPAAAIQRSTGLRLSTPVQLERGAIACADVTLSVFALSFTVPPF